MFTREMRIKTFLIIVLTLQVSSAFASHFDFCTFKGSILDVLESENSGHKEGVMKILVAKRSNDLGYTDCQDFIGQEHSFLFSTENVISKENLVEVTYKYWEDINGKAHENWVILSVGK